MDPRWRHLFLPQRGKRFVYDRAQRKGCKLYQRISEEYHGFQPDSKQKFRLEQVSSNGTNRVVDIQRVGTKPTAGKLDIKYQKFTEVGDNMDKFCFSFDLDTELRYTSVLPCSLSLHGNDLMSGSNREITSLIVTSDEIIVLQIPLTRNIRIGTFRGQNV